MKNRMLIKFDSVSENEGFARNVIASFLLPLNPGIGELTDIKTAVSEAVTNAIVHGYPDTVGEVTMLAETDGENVHIVISEWESTTSKRRWSRFTPQNPTTNVREWGSP